MSLNSPRTGSCLCGKVRLDIQQLERQVVACHCTQCRKQTGHFVAATRVDNEHLFIDGDEHINWYKSSDDAERGFCKHCGSIMLWRMKDSARTSVMAGCLDGDSGLKIDRHIYVENKGDYYDLESHIPQFSESD
jgi:hypothetical protein